MVEDREDRWPLCQGGEGLMPDNTRDCYRTLLNWCNAKRKTKFYNKELPKSFQANGQMLKLRNRGFIHIAKRGHRGGPHLWEIKKVKV